MVKSALNVLIGLVLGMVLVQPTFAQEEQADELSSNSVTLPDDEADSAVRTAPGTQPNSNSDGNNVSRQDDAREAGRRGLVMSYGRVLKKLKQTVPGDVVKVRLLQFNKVLGIKSPVNKSTWTYEVTVLDEAGRYTLVSLNAYTGAIISKKRR
jgi:uncharacterized membrane protein YkoI